jgi:plastocyanin
MAMGWGHGGMMPWNHNPGPMMGQSGHSSMMGQSGHGSMMGGNYGSGTVGTPLAGVTQVQIVNYAFTPASIQVPVGTTVRWINLDAAPHTVTFKQEKGGSGMLEKGQTFSYTFMSPGVYSYDCAVHPYMIATVTVTS